MQRWDSTAIRDLRARLEMNQEELARRLGVSVSSVQKWETGARTPVGLYARALDSLDESTRLLAV